MIEVMDECHGNIVGLRATGKLTAADYRDVIAPRIQSLLERFRRLRVLFLMDESFDGWSLGAAWANTVLDLKHRRHFDKIAMVGAPEWEQWCVNLAAAALMKGQMRTFQREQLTEALDWLR